MIASTPSAVTWMTSWPFIPRRVGFERGSVVGEQTLWSSATRGALVEHRDRCFSGLAARHVRGDREARMIVLELEDHAGPAVGEDVLGRIQLPARVRCRIDKPPPGRARPLPRLQSSHASFAEDPCQPRDFMGAWSRPADGMEKGAPDLE